ncbi:hypothetical protein N8Z33_03240, partial [Flavobacteriaceae bacterium]|nr:hypothetical protein [Flavobacteriaceae bacterium]
MKHFFLFICLASQVVFAQVGIGTSAPLASAILDLDSTTQGFLLPRMTQAQMVAIASPAAGLVVYCNDCTPQPGPYYYDGANFVHFTTGSQSSALSSLDCSSAVDTGSMLQLNPNSGVETAVPYVASAQGQYNGTSVPSTGVLGLTATSIPGTFSSSGNIPFYITGTPQASGTASFAITLAGQSCTFTRNVVPIPIVASIDCSSMSFPTFIQGVAVSQSISLAYTGGNGQPYASFSSSTVNGLRIDFNAGTLNNGSGTFIGTLSGTPQVATTSQLFSVSFGQLATSCNRSIQVFNNIAGVAYLVASDRITTNSSIANDLSALGKTRSDLISLADLDIIRSDSRYNTSAKIQAFFGLATPNSGSTWIL